MSEIITPTVGRVVWFYPASNTAESGFSRRPGGGPYAALIAHVWHDRMVNLSVLDANGNPHSRTSVPMVQGDDPAPDSAFCGWMPFQKGQAKAQTAMAEANSQKDANGPVLANHASEVLYPAIHDAMEELGALHPGFNDRVNRAWNHLHRAFWSQVPAPASAPGLRDPNPAAEPGFDLSPVRQQDASVEQAIHSKGKTAPRVTPADLAANIVDTEIVKYVAPSGQILRWAVLTTRSGFAVTGRPSAAVSAENDDPEIGVATAIENARNELWPLMGYALKQRLHDAAA